MPIGGWGVDLSGRDLAIKPGDDFDAYANGAWKARTPIPADRPQIGTLALMDEQVQGQMRARRAGPARWQGRRALRQLPR
jgi:putative endopeptidase